MRSTLDSTIAAASALAHARDFRVSRRVAVGEALQNIIRHGFAGGSARGRITMTLEIRQDALLVDIDDTAPPSLPSSWSAKGREAHEGGLGLNMIHSIASDVSFTPTADGNHASLTFNPD